jgi:hypothetical protein
MRRIFMVIVPVIDRILIQFIPDEPHPSKNPGPLAWPGFGTRRS